MPSVAETGPLVCCEAPTSIRQEHDACGVGLVAALDGKPRREVVEAGIDALKAVWHRGAVDADGKTGDGAGIHVEIPQDFFAEQSERGGDQVRAPGRSRSAWCSCRKTDLGAQERCRTIVETEILSFGYHHLRLAPGAGERRGDRRKGQRHPARDRADHGLANARGRRRARRFETRALHHPPAHREAGDRRRRSPSSTSARCPAARSSTRACSWPSSSTEFYPDLLDERFISRFAIYHQRYSTNTFPTWRLAQPFRMLAHNGEINTLAGNINWMRSHETRLADPAFDTSMEDIKPVVQAGGSDTAALDNVFELLVRGRARRADGQGDADPGKRSASDATMPQAHRDMFRLLQRA